MGCKRLLASMALWAACADEPSGPGPNPDPEPEVPRGPSELLVERFSRAGERSFYTMAPNGSAVAPFPDVPADAIAVYPAPDGRTIAYLLHTPDDDVHLWLMNRDGTNRRALLEGTRVVEDVAWSPNGARLAVTQSTLDTSGDLWVMNADGSGLVNLTPDPLPGIVFDRSPSWSPDGSRIAFSSTRTGTTRLWIMNANGTNPVQVVSTLSATEQTPVWSPDGVRIAFVAATSATVGIGVVAPDGSGYTAFPITAEFGRLAWSPDGRVLYSSAAEGNYELYALAPATGDVENLTRHRDHDFRAVALRYVAPSAWQGFAPAVRYEAASPGAAGLGVGDLQRDGAPDVAILAPAASEIRVLRGIGSGAFQPLGGLTAGPDQRALAVADVSRDTFADIVVLEPESLAVWRGGSGGPGLATRHAFGGLGRGLAASDFDGDGSVDLAAIHRGPQGDVRMMVFGARTGDGELVAIVDYSAGFTGPGGACAGDVTREGYEDVVVVTGDGSAPLLLLPGHGDITFADAVVANALVPADSTAIPACADFNRDRTADVALLRPGQPGGLAVLLSNGIELGAPTGVPVQGTDLAAADVDHDGDVDLVVAREAPGTLAFLRNLGDGRFAPAVTIGIGGAPRRVIATDLNGDRWADLAVADADGSVAVWLNRRR